MNNKTKVDFTKSTATTATTLPRGESAACVLRLRKPMGFHLKNDRSEVKKLQEFLNEYYHLSIPVTGFFGQMTLDALKKLQSDHADSILKPSELTAPSGYVYKFTLKWINEYHCQNN